MIDLNEARKAACRKNLERYRRILTTPLTDVERAYVKRRLEEEREQLAALEDAVNRGKDGALCPDSSASSAGMPSLASTASIGGNLHSNTGLASYEGR